MGWSITHGAVRPSHRSPAMKVCVAQCPNGASAFNRAPRRARPRRRVILVVVPVSSRKTSRWTPSRMRGWRCAFHSSRAWRTSSRSASEATSVFFEGQARLQQHPRQRRRMHRHILLGLQFGRQLRHRDVWLALDPFEQSPKIGGQFAAARRPPLALRLGRSCARYPIGQLHREACAHIVAASRRTSRLPTPNGRLDTFPKVNRVRLSHPYWPPCPASILNQISDSLGIPFRFLFQARRSSPREPRVARCLEGWDATRGEWYPPATGMRARPLGEVNMHAIGIALVLAALAVPAHAQQRVTIGDKEAILHMPPNPRASAVLVPGKGGIDPSDPLLRNREALNARGIATLTVPHQTRLGQAIDYMRQIKAPVALIGMSAGVSFAALGVGRGAKPDMLILISGSLMAPG